MKLNPYLRAPSLLNLGAGSESPLPASRLRPEHRLPGLASFLNEEPPTAKELIRELIQYMFKHARPEMFCILACEISEILAAIGLFKSDVEWWNNGALLGGFTGGFAFASWHIYKHAQEHGIPAKVRDALQQALSAESGCVVGATTTEWIAGNLSNAQTPYDIQAICYSAAGLPIAFGVGLLAMSSTALVRADIFGRCIVEKGQLPDAMSSLRTDFQAQGLELAVRRGGKKIDIAGAKTTFRIVSGALPEYLTEQYDPQKFSYFTLRHPAARSLNGRAEVKGVLGGFVDSVVPERVKVSNPYSCTGGHGHKH